MEYASYFSIFAMVIMITAAQEVVENQEENQSPEEGEGRIFGLGHLIHGGQALAQAVVGGVLHGSNFAGSRLQQSLFGGPIAQPFSPAPFPYPYYNSYYAPNFAPGFAPNFAPGFAPNFAPGFAPNYGPGFSRTPGMHRPGLHGTYQSQFKTTDDPYPLNFDGNESPTEKSYDY